MNATLGPDLIASINSWASWPRARELIEKEQLAGYSQAMSVGIAPQARPARARNHSVEDGNPRRMATTGVNRERVELVLTPKYATIFLGCKRGQCS
jgi:hypothetical protein